MSFVSVVAKENFITVMSDGLVVDTNTGEIKMEDYQKFIKINDSSFVAYAGVKEICEIVAKNVCRSIEEGISFKNIMLILQKTVSTIVGPGLSLMIAYGGINEHGEIEIYSYASKQDAIKHFKPKDTEAAYLFLTKGDAGEKELDEIFVQFLRESGAHSPTSIIQAQKLMNKYVSERDASVNNKTFRLVLKK